MLKNYTFKTSIHARLFHVITTFDPMQFNDVIGHTELKAQLQKMTDTGRISHALMFSGSEGSGNLALALAFGSYLLQKTSENPEAARKKTEKLIHPDFHFCYPVNGNEKVTSTKVVSADFITEWRQAAMANPYMAMGDWMAHLGIAKKQGIINVNQASEIISDLKLKPYEAEYKIMLIWLPEKMNPSAANKLLKILEEPPEKTIFLLVSQHPEQLLATIQSRVQLIHVKPIEHAHLKAALIEHHQLSNEKADTIARIAQGNYLKSQKLITENEIRTFNQQMFIQWMRFLWQKEFLELMQWTDTLSKMGRERLIQFLKHGLHVLRESLMMNYADPSVQMTEGEEKAFITKFSPYVNALNVVDMVSLFEEAEYHISRNGNAKIILMDVSLKMMKLVRKKIK